MRKKIKPIIAVIILAILAVLSVTMVVYGVVNLINDRAENADVPETIESTQESLEEKIEDIAEMMTKETESEEDIAEMMTKETEVTTESTTEPTTEPTAVPTTEPPTETTAPPETTSATETTDPEPNIGMTDLDMLACVIYQEAGSDSSCDDCRRRVADVVLNRVADERFPDTIYEVLTQRSQYGRFHWTGVVWPSRANSQYEQHAVERAYRIAEEVLNGQHSDVYGKGYIWQAEFKQGTDIIYHCGTYFGRS